MCVEAGFSQIQSHMQLHGKINDMTEVSLTLASSYIYISYAEIKFGRRSAGADLYNSLREGAKPSSGSLKQGVWGSPPEAIGYLAFEVSKPKVQSTFDEFLKEANKMYVLLKEEVW